MNEQKLKPCPFCGGEAHCDRHDIFCDCGIKIEIPIYVSGSTSVGGFPTYEEAVQMMVEAWNDRADDNLINRQKAEIERLESYNENLIAANTALSNEILDIKSEAIKEFAERLKRDITINNTEDGCLIYSIDYGCLMEDIDNLVEEMTEDKDA